MDITELNKRLGSLVLPNDEYIQSIFDDSLLKDQAGYIPKRNEAFISIGKSVIEAAYAMFLYIHCPGIKLMDFQDKVEQNCRTVETRIYNRFRLGNLIEATERADEEQCYHVVLKLVAVIYRLYGFRETYYYFEQNFPKQRPEKSYIRIQQKKMDTQLYRHMSDQELVKLYSSLIGKKQQYSQDMNHRDKKGRKITFSVGDKQVHGFFQMTPDQGIVWSVRQALLHGFVKRYNLPLEIAYLKLKIGSQEALRQSKNLWIAVVQNLKKVEGLHVVKPSDVYLKRIFSTDSLGKDGLAPNVFLHSDLGLTAVGEYILKLMAQTFIFINVGIDDPSIDKDCKVLLDNRSLAGLLPNGFPVEKIYSNTIAEPDKVEQIKAEIIRRMFAAIWLDCLIKREKPSNEEAVKTFSYGILEQSYKKIFSDSKAAKNSFFAKHHLMGRYGYTTFYRTQKSSRFFICKLNLRGMSGETDIVACGTSPAFAAYNADQALLIIGQQNRSKLLHCMPNYQSFISPKLRRFIDYELTARERNRFHQEAMLIDCTNQGTVKRQSLTPALENINVLATVKPIQSRPAVTLHNTPSEVIFDPTQHILYVCKGVASCEKRHHEITTVTGLIPTGDHKLAKLTDVNYCRQCGIYFLSLDEYKHFQDKYGLLLGNIQPYEAYSGGIGFANWAPMSVMKLYGYNVSKAEGLTVMQRHSILSKLIDNKIMSKGAIIDHLNRMIRFQGRRENMEDALEKWYDDLEWVREYEVKSQRQQRFSQVKQYRGKR